MGQKWWIILIALPFIAYFGYKAKTALVTFQANLTYSMNDGSGGGGGLSGILGSFGLGKGGKVNLDKIVELSKSRNIIQKYFSLLFLWILWMARQIILPII